MGAMLCTSVFDIHGQLVEEEHDGTLSAIMSAQHHWPFLLGAHLALPALPPPMVSMDTGRMILASTPDPADWSEHLKPVQ